MFVPLNKNPPAALIVPVTERFPVVPVSVNVKRVLGDDSASLIVKTPLLPRVASVTTGAELDNVIGNALENVLVLLNAFAWLRYATFVKVPAVLISAPLNWIAEVPLRVPPWIVPDAVIDVAPVIEPAFVIPPVLLLMPPDAEIPPEAVSKPADVTVPLPVVVIFPDVEIVPSSEIVSLLVPPDLISSAVLVAPFVSLIINDGAVPALVKVNDVAVPELLDSSYKVNAIFLPVVVVIVFPPL